MAEKQSYKRVPVITDFCTGCGKCVDVCPHSCLKPVWDFATLVAPDACTSACDCISVCEDDAIHMRWVKMGGNVEAGDWCDNPPKPARKGLLDIIKGLFGESSLHPEYSEPSKTTIDPK